MKTYKIKKSYEIIEGYTYEIFEVEANSYEEAVEKIDSDELDPVDDDTYIKQVEFNHIEEIKTQ